MKNIFAYITHSENLKVFTNNIEFYLGDYKKIVPKNSELYVIDVSSIISSDKKNYINHFKKVRINYIRITKISDLIKILKKFNIIGILKIPNTPKTYYIHFLLKFYNVKSIMISNKGLIYDYSIKSGINYRKNFLEGFLSKLYYYFYRFLTIIGIFPKFDLFFDSNQTTIKSILLGKSKKIEKIFPFLKISFYKEIFRINSREYSIVRKNKKKIEEKYIVFCDGGFDHNDRIIREGKISNTIRNSYYKNLFFFLNTISKKFNKKVIYCLHPKTPLPKNKYFDKIKSNFSVKIYETEKFIRKAFIIIYYVSSSINTGIILRKKILNIKSKYLGDYYLKRSSQEVKEIGVHNIDIDKFSQIDLRDLIYKLKSRIKNYKVYEKKKLVFERNIDWHDQVKKILYKKFKIIN